MAMTKRSVILDADLVEQALRIAGPRGFSRLVNAALRQYLQAQRLERLEAELAAEHGPIPPEVWAWAERIEWPT
jgi:Arc/MetJ family transcription regulator